MSDFEQAAQPQAVAKAGFSGLQVAGIVLLTIVVTIALGWWIVRTYIFPAELKPVELSLEERQQLDRKLEKLGLDVAGVAVTEDGREIAVPVPYSEDDASRDVRLTERELNGLIAGDPNLGNSVAIDLDNDLASIVALVPIPEDFPIMAGRTLRVRGGAEVAYRDGRPVVMLKGVSLMGVPVPNAWLGDLKNVDLVKEFSGNDGFWQAFAAGVEEISVTDGEIHIRLKE
jgi:hypothetical protein